MPIMDKDVVCRMTGVEVVRYKLAILALCVALIVWVTPAGAITGGELDGQGHPNVGAVIVSSDLADPFMFCSGTLIGEKVFLTFWTLHALLEIPIGKTRGPSICELQLGQSLRRRMAAGSGSHHAPRL